MKHMRIIDVYRDVHTDRTIYILHVQRWGFILFCLAGSSFASHNIYVHDVQYNIIVTVNIIVCIDLNRTFKWFCFITFPLFVQKYLIPNGLQH